MKFMYRLLAYGLAFLLVITVLPAVGAAPASVRAEGTDELVFWLNTDDWYTLPDNYGDIQRDGEGFVRNERYPDGWNFHWTLRDFYVESETPDDGDPSSHVIEVLDADNGQFHALQTGTAVVAMVLTADEDEDVTETFFRSVFVTERFYELRINAADDCWELLPGTQARLSAELWRIYRNDEGWYTEEIDEDPVIGWSIAEGEELAAVATASGGREITVTGQQNGTGRVRLAASVQQGSDPIPVSVPSEISLNVSNRFNVIRPGDLQALLPVFPGSETALYPGFYDISWDAQAQDASEVEYLEDIRWRWDVSNTDALEVLDADGNVLTDKEPGAYVYTSASYPDDPSYDGFTIRRLSPEGTEVTLWVEHYREDADIWEQWRQTRCWLPDFRPDLRIDGGGDPIRVFSDETRSASLDLSELRALAPETAFDVEWTFGWWDEVLGEFVPDPNVSAALTPHTDDGGLYIVSIDGAVLYDAVTARFQGGADLHAFVWNEDHSVLVAEAQSWVESHMARYDYPLPQDRTLLPGWNEFISRENGFHVENAQYPEGFDGSFEIMSIETASEQPAEEGQPVLWIGEDDEGFGWDIVALNAGTAQILLTWLDAFGAEQQSTVTYTVASDYYEVHIDFPEGTNRGLPGASVTLYANARHENDIAGEIPLEDGEGNPTGTYVWTLGEGTEALAVIEPMTDPRFAVVHFLSDAPVNGSFRIPVSVKFYDGTDPAADDPQAENEAEVWIEEQYMEIRLVDAGGNNVLFDSRQALGTEQTVIPQLRSYPGENGDPYDVIPDVRWRWANFGDDQLLITDAEGETVGIYDEETWEYQYTQGSVGTDAYQPAFTVLRRGTEEYRPWISASVYDGHDWIDVSNLELFLERLEYHLWFDTDENLNVYSDETKDYVVRLDGFADMPADGYRLEVLVDGRHPESGDWGTAQVWDGSGYEDIGEGNGYTLALDAEAGTLTVTLDGSCFFDPADENPPRTDLEIRVRALIDNPANQDDPTVLAEERLQLQACPVRADYEFEQDSNIQKTWWWIVPKMNRVWVENGSWPDGQELEYEVTGVAVEDPALATVEAIPSDEDPSVTDGWKIAPTDAAEYGDDILVTVSYNDINGNPQSYQFRLYLRGDFYEVHIHSENGEHDVNCGGSLTLTADGIHFSNETRVPLENETWHWLCTLGWNEEDDFWNVRNDDLGQIDVDTEDPSKAVITIGQLPEDVFWEGLDVTAYLTDSENRILAADTFRIDVNALAHTHAAGDAVRENEVPATCETAGSYDEVVYCSICGAELSREVKEIPATGHSYGAWTKFDKNQHQHVCAYDASHVEKENHSWDAGTVTTAATCTTDGVKTYTCTACGETKTEKISKTGHHYGAWTKLDNNQHQRVCANDASHVEKENHSWDAGKVTKTATCTTDGVKTYTCSVCKATKTEKISKTGHNYGAWTKLDKNQHQRVCANDASHVEKENHSWDAGKVTTPATCAVDGVKTYTCSVCKATKTEKIPKESQHKWDAGKVTTAATCTTDGVKTYTCTVCKATKTEKIPKTGHSYGAWTRLDENQHQRVCANDASHVEKENHQWDAGKVTTAATCAADGVKTYTCSACGATKTESIPKTGQHQWDAGKVTRQPTTTEEGVRTYTCKVCGATRTASIAKLAVDSVPMYRLYMPDTHEHFYTANEYERHVLLTERGWEDEGVGWYAPKEGDPVYRLFNPYTTDHHYTKDFNEYNILGNSGWEQEGIGWYSDPNQGVPLYRLFTPALEVGSHHYTMDAYERSQLIAGGAWEDEGVGWYGVKK